MRQLVEFDHLEFSVPDVSNWNFKGKARSPFKCAMKADDSVPRNVLLHDLAKNKLHLYQSRHTSKMEVLIVAAVTIQLVTVCCTISVTFTPKIVEHPRDGTGPKLVAKRLAMNVNRLFATAGAGDVAFVNKA
jgi:hypothetical protein